MIVYWLLFGFAALMALTFPANVQRARLGAAQSLALLIFLAAYILLAGLRYRIGGDWTEYDGLYDSVRQSSLWQAMRLTDPFFGVILWISAKLQLGIYPADGICAGLIGYGALRVAMTTRDPWLAIVAAVPYLLIVVGMGYVRQAGAIGMVMIAATSAGRESWRGTFAKLALAAGLHSTSSVTFPLFGRVLASRNRAIAIVLTAIGVGVFLYILSRRLAEYQLGYLGSEYDSGGATVRLLMSLVPSLLLLARWRHFRVEGDARIIWLGCALANVAAMVALTISPSSTAVDRMALYFAPIQLVVFGSLMDLLGASRASTYLIRMLAIAVAAGVQLVWLVFATHADLWVPYRSILELI